MNKNDIAIVGMACNFPGGRGLESFWNTLLSGTDAVTKVPPSRWKAEEYLAKEGQAGQPMKMVSDQGGFVDEIELFDSSFFGISDSEALYLDPQQRMLMECGWEALEHAGIVPSTLQGSNTGVFMGSCSHDYSVLSWPKFDDIYIGTGTSNALAANRLSYFLKLNGPSMNLDSACSSSLTALHVACNTINAGEIDCALVGGSNLLLLPSINCSLSKAGLISSSGRCHSFGSEASGYIRSEGAGVIVVMPVGVAEKLDARIICTIKASGINHNGASNGLMAPSPKAQKSLLESVYQRASLDPANVQYLEAAATGTQMGDAIEMKAIQDYFGANRGDQNSPLRVGSLKSNIGHMEGAGGIAGVIKAALIADRGIVPASLHSQELNPLIRPVDNIEVPQINTQFAQGSDDQGERIQNSDSDALIGVSSFGFGGSNGHVVIGQYKLEQRSEIAQFEKKRRLAAQGMRLEGQQQGYPILLSAKTSGALRELVQNLVVWLEANSGSSIQDIAYTFALHREHFSHRLACIANSINDLKQQLISQLSVIEDSVTIDTRSQAVSLVIDYESSQASDWLRRLYHDHEFRQCLQAELDNIDSETAYKLNELLGLENVSASAELTSLTDDEFFLLDYLIVRFLGKLFPKIRRYLVSKHKVLAVQVALGELTLPQGLARASQSVNDLSTKSSSLIDGDVSVKQNITELPTNVELLPEHQGNNGDTLAADGKSIDLKRGELLLAVGPEVNDSVVNSDIRLYCEEHSGLAGVILDAYLRNVSLELSALFKARSYSLIDLPTYAFQRQYFWPDGITFKREKTSNRVGSLVDCLDAKTVTKAYKGVHWFEYILSTDHSALLADHVILDFPIVAASTQIILVATQLEKILKTQNMDMSACLLLSDLTLQNALLLSKTEELTARLLVDNSVSSESSISASPVSETSGIFQLLSQRGERWDEHLQGEWSSTKERSQQPEFETAVSSDIVSELGTVEVDKFYEVLAKKGYVFGPHHRWLKSVRLGEDWVEGLIEPHRDIKYYLAPLSPGIIDTSFHLLELLAQVNGCPCSDEAGSEFIALPVSVQTLWCDFDRLEKSTYKIQVHLCESSDVERRADVFIMGPDNELQIAMHSVVFKFVDKAKLAAHWQSISMSTSDTTIESERAISLQNEGPLSDQLVALVCHVLAISLDAEKMSMPVRDLGVDSLKAVEISQLTQKHFGVKLSLQDLMTDLTVDQMVSTVVRSYSTNENTSTVSELKGDQQLIEERIDVEKIANNNEAIMELEL